MRLNTFKVDTYSVAGGWWWWEVGVWGVGGVEGRYVGMQTPSTGLQYSFLEHCHNWLEREEGGGGGGVSGHANSKH